MASVEIQLLGRFEVMVEGRTVPASAWRHRRAAGLVKLLALASGHRVHREQMIEALWPHLPPVGGERNLHKAIHLARRGIGDPSAITLSSQEVGFGGDVAVMSSGSKGRPNSRSGHLTKAGVRRRPPSIPASCSRRIDTRSGLSRRANASVSCAWGCCAARSAGAMCWRSSLLTRRLIVP
jgi:hypothetical protein